ncbi:hypothetical protein CF327_g7099, partial [Tilletia walkeri]
MNLRSFVGFFALTGIAKALTTGPYDVFSQFDQYLPYAFQGHMTSIVNQTIPCDVSGSGLSLTNASFLFKAVSYFPSRINDTTYAASFRSYVSMGIPLIVTSYFAKAGASSMTIRNDSVLSVKFSGFADGSAVQAYRILGGTMQEARLTGASYTIVSLDGIFGSAGAIPLRGAKSTGPSSNVLAVVPDRRLIIQQDRLTFSLSAAGKIADITCAAGVRPTNFGFANIVDLPGPVAGGAFANTIGGTNSTPPFNSTTFSSSYRPICTFSGIGKKPIAISLGGFKSNRPISTASPAVFSLGQSNFGGLSTISLYQTKYPSTNTVSVKLSAFNVSISNATPSIKNLLPAGGFVSAKLSGGFATFPSAAPSVTYPSATFTPIASSIGKGQLAFLSYDNVAGSVKLFDANSTAIATVAFSCSEGAGKGSTLSSRRLFKVSHWSWHRLLVYEPRYRLMVRRCLESGNPRFGMVMPARTSSPNAPGMYEYGTMLEIRSVQMLPDGRSMIETVGSYRFRVLETGTLDGYSVGRVERIEDVGLEEEMEME